MSVEAALRRHAETEVWPAYPECDDFQSEVSRHSRRDDTGWNVVRLQPNRARSFATGAPLVAGALQSRAPDHQIELRRLADEWYAETAFMSSMQAQIMHPAYQQIIGFGEKALPFLIDELRSSDGYWFWALRMITRENPAAENIQGNYAAIKQSWLTWASQRDI